MRLPLFALNTESKSVAPPGQLVWEGADEETAGAYESRFQIPEGHVILTTWRGNLHCVIYQTPLGDETAIESRNVGLFEHYGEGERWIEILDNGFGKTYRREDMQRFALWSYAMDIVTVGTMEFHEVMGNNNIDSDES